MASANPFAKRSKRMDAMRQLRAKTATEDKKLAEAKRLNFECPTCKVVYPPQILKENDYLCEGCGYHFKMPSNLRIASIFDGEYEELDAGLVGNNPLNFPEYSKKIEDNQEKSDMAEAVRCAIGTIDGRRCVMAVLDSRFLMGSMGVAVGEKITRAIERATEEKLPLIIFSASGGARMQEGIFSLMQMAKTSAAIARHDEAGLLYISVMTNPTTGGVTASFASLGDIILAEPKAQIGFAGPRVIEQTIRQKLPDGFQSAEYMLEHGFLDGIVERKEMKKTLSLLLKLHERRGSIDA